jgi:uncharacterized membrane protein YkoI
MRIIGRTATLAVLGFGLVAAVSRAGEEKIPLSQVPKPVIKAFETKFPKAEIKTAIKEEEGGKTVYEIESMLKGLTVDAVLKPDGEFVEIEEEIKAADLPAAVSHGFKAKYPKGEISRVEVVTKDGKTSYEVGTKKADGKAITVSLDKTGKILGEE